MFRYGERGVLCSGMKREVWCVHVRRERCVVFRNEERESCAVFRYEERGVLCSGMKRERCAVFRYEERGVLCSDMKREVCCVQI